MSKKVVLAIIGFVLVTQYMNCSSYSTGISSASLATDSTNSIQAFQGIQVNNSDTYLNCDEDHVDVGGPCNTADAVDNYIQYSITLNRQTIYWGTESSQTVYLTSAKCEDGHFFAVIPRPNDPELYQGGTDTIEYQLHFQLFTSPDRISYAAGDMSPQFNIEIEENGLCNN